MCHSDEHFENNRYQISYILFYQYIISRIPFTYGTLINKPIPISLEICF